MHNGIPIVAWKLCAIKVSNLIVKFSHSSLKTIVVEHIRHSLTLAMTFGIRVILLFAISIAAENQKQNNASCLTLFQQLYTTTDCYKQLILQNWVCLLA